MTVRFDEGSVDAVVLDIEGTTSATGFVVDVLYPYARERFGALLASRGDEPEVARAVAQVRELAGEPDADTGRVEKILGEWVDADRKATPLKTLQGILWAEGFARGELISHFYPEVIDVLRGWAADGVRLYVYSSGSVAAQRAWFTYTPEGSLLDLVSGFYDTENAGPKQEPGSYRAISAAVGVDPGRTLFLSDRLGELDAARDAGWRVVGVRRAGEPYFAAGVGGHPEAAAFDEISLVRNQEHAMSETTASLDLEEAGAVLAAEAARFASFGWMRGTSGNLSVVLSRTPLQLAVTASGRDKGELTSADVVLTDASGAALGAGRPSAEAALHARVAALTGAGAVVHVHTVASVAMGHRKPGGVAFRDLEMLKGLGHGTHEVAVTLPVIENSQDMEVLGDRLEAALQPGMPAVVVAGHGLYVWGADPREARHRTEVVEWLLELELTRG
ncbi:acireductone synthase [Streptomyces sp. NPDC050147]|uniref:acireductone synthase n=1 Tax=Streptomyces sp. NPDC050147 TaxID=3155513 RepID=UPI00341CCE9E